KTAENCRRTPEGESREPGVLVGREEIEALFGPGRRQLKRSPPVARQLQIGTRFGLAGIQGERAFIIQNRMAEIISAEISVSKVIKKPWIPLSGGYERFVALNRFRKLSRGIIGVGARESRVRIGED